MGRSRNGFQFPLHPWQIMSWLLQIYNVSLTLLLLSVYSKSRLLIALFSGNVLFQLLVITLGFLVTKSDPTWKSPVDYDGADTYNAFYCSVCKQKVKESTKHCGTCERCVDKFDHHCKLLNNCVGDENYMLFVWLISSVELLEFFLLPLLALSLSEMDTDSDIVYIVLTITNIVLNSFLFIFMTYLIGFHIYLKFKKMTTYELIVSRRSVQDNTARDEGKLEESSMKSAKITPANSPERVEEVEKMVNTKD